MSPRNPLRLVSTFLLLAVLCAPSTGCKSNQIPLLNPSARLVNRANSGLESVTELNLYAAQLRNDGLITQAQIDAVSPQIDKAEALFRAGRTLARAATSQPTTQPASDSIAQAKQILESVRTSLEAMRRKP